MGDLLMQQPNPTPAQAAKRVDDLIEQRLRGMEWFNVVQYVRSQESEEGSPWHVPPGYKPLTVSAIRKWVQKADKAIETYHDKRRKVVLRRHLSRVSFLYGKAVENGDIKAALSCLQHQAKVVGLYAPDRVAHTDTKGNDLPVTFVEVLTHAVSQPEGGSVGAAVPSFDGADYQTNG